MPKPALGQEVGQDDWDSEGNWETSLEGCLFYSPLWTVWNTGSLEVPTDLEGMNTLPRATGQYSDLVLSETLAAGLGRRQEDTISFLSQKD